MDTLPLRSCARPARRFLGLGLVVLLAACGDDPSPAETATSEPTAFVLTAPDTVLAGQPFDLSVTAVGPDGMSTDTEFSGSVTLAVSAGRITPASVTLSAGVTQQQVTVTELAGAVTLSATRGNASGTADVVAVGLEPVARVEVVPGSVLLTTPEETRQLSARAFDADGNPTQAEFTWTSSDPGIVSLGPSGLATGGSEVGAAQIAASAQGVESRPVVVVAARLVAGAVLIGDDEVVSAEPVALAAGVVGSVGPPAPARSYSIEAVDPDAEYGLGWQYRVVLTRPEAPSVGEVLVGTGDAPIAGRVVSVTPRGVDHEVTLELVEIDQVFEDLVFEEDLALDDSEVVLDEAVAAFYTVERSEDGALDFVPNPETSELQARFQVGPFQCKSEIGLPVQLRVVPTIRIRPDIDWVPRVRSGEGMSFIGVRGVLHMDIKVDPKISTRFEGTLECAADIARLIVPLPGPVGLFLGGHVPIRGGFEIKGTMTAAELGVKVTATAAPQIDIGVRCEAGRVDCPTGVFLSEGSPAPGASVEFDDPALNPTPRLQLRVYGFVSASIGIGPSALIALATANQVPAFEFIEGRFGLAQNVDLKAVLDQIEDTGYDSDWYLSLLGVVRPGKGFDRILKLFGRTAIRLEARAEIPLTSLPKGELTVTPSEVVASSSQYPGDVAKFRVALDKSTYLRVEAIEAVHLMWTEVDDSGAVSWRRGSYPCDVLPASSGQTVFECETEFPDTEIGEHRFHAFIKAKLFGVPTLGYYEIGDDATVLLTVEESKPKVTVSPRAEFLVHGTAAQFTAIVTRAADPSVSWSASLGSINEQGEYLAPLIPLGEALVDTVVARSAEDPSASDTALVVVSAPRIIPSDNACTPTPSDDCSRDGRSWGDPHLVTPDGNVYDFMASGDYILAKSTDPEDDFEIQARYTQPQGDELFSWNHAAAMSVAGHVVEVYAGEAHDIPSVYIDGAFKPMRENNVNNFYDLDGGSVTLVGDSVAVSWPDRTLVMVKPSGNTGVLSEIRVNVPHSRAGAVEGLFGDFDGDRSDDVRVRNGTIVDPLGTDLYTEFRQSWWVPLGSSESLFGRGVEHFDASFPPGAITIGDLDVDEVVEGTEVCRAAGVLDPDVMQACILDVVLTGDDQWAFVAAGLDPNTLGILVSPQAAYIAPGATQEFGAIVTGTTDRRVEWTATGGAIVPTGDNVMTYTAPEEKGVYTITATLVADGTLVSTATVHITGAPTGFTKQWNGTTSSDWYNPDNWIPVGVPDSTDNVYVPAEPARRLTWGIIPAVNDLWIEEGGADPRGRGIRVYGDANVKSDVHLVMIGVGKSVQGRIGLLQVGNGVVGPSVVASGPLVVTRREGIGLYGGTFDVGSQRVESAGGLVGPAAVAGRLVMQHPDAHLVVPGAAFYRLRSGAGSLTAGTLEVLGNMSVSGSATFVATDQHRVVLRGDGSFQQSISMANTVQPSTIHILNDLVIDNPAGAILGIGALQVNGTITLTTGGRVFGNSESSAVHLSKMLEDPEGGWEVPLVVRAPGVLLPPQLNSDITFGGVEPLDVTLLSDLTARNVTIGANSQLTLGDHTLGVSGDLRVENGGRLPLGSQALAVGGNLITVRSGSIVMDADGQRLTVSGNATFGQNASGPAVAGALFSAGEFELAGNLTERYAHYRPSGTHVTRFTGNAAQTVNSHCWYTNCARDAGGNAPSFAGVEVTNPAGVTFGGRRIPISGLFTVKADAAATFNGWIDLAGSLDVAGALTVTSAAQITVAEMLFLRAAAFLDNQGVMTVASCTKEDGHTINGSDPCQ